MFTGIVQCMGKVARVEGRSSGRRLSIEADGMGEAFQIGESINVSGACLTVSAVEGTSFNVDGVPETLAKTTLGYLVPGQKVNLERALRASDRLGGHIVNGHVEGMGSVAARRQQGLDFILRIKMPSAILRYCLTEGSIAIDGVSLTIARVGPDWVEVAIVPHTARVTTLGTRQPGDKVNLETDLVVKAMEKFAAKPAKGAGEEPGRITLEFLKEKGFL